MGNVSGEIMLPLVTSLLDKLYATDVDSIDFTERINLSNNIKEKLNTAESYIETNDFFNSMKIYYEILKDDGYYSHAVIGLYKNLALIGMVNECLFLSIKCCVNATKSLDPSKDKTIINNVLNDMYSIRDSIIKDYQDGSIVNCEKLCKTFSSDKFKFTEKARVLCIGCIPGAIAWLRKNC